MTTDHTGIVHPSDGDLDPLNPHATSRDRHEAGGRIRPADARYPLHRNLLTAAERAAIREKEINDGWARVAEQQKAENDRVDRELARQEGREPESRGGTLQRIRQFLLGPDTTEDH